MLNETTYCHYSDLPSPLAYMEVINNKKTMSLTDVEINRVIEMAWEDRTTFEAIKFQFGLNESAVRALMKEKLKFSSYKLWRRRVELCKTKHARIRSASINRFKCKRQSHISFNKISKRRIK